MRLRRAFPPLAIALAALLAVGVNLAAQRFGAGLRLDLTEDRLYTLAPGTRQVLAGLREPVTLRLFFSRRLGAAAPEFGAHADRVRSMLREYAAVSAGRLRIEELDPEPFSDAEDRAVALGLQAVPLSDAGDQVFFGLAGQAGSGDGGERAIPFLQPDRERFLEADLTRLVFDLASPGKPVMALLTPLPLNGDPRALLLRQPALARPMVVMDQLRDAYEVRDLAPGIAAIPPETRVLLVVHPQGLPDAAQYAIDQFVLGGGRLILMLDPHSEMQGARPGPDGQPPGPLSSSLDRLLHAWGVEAPAGEVVLDLRGAWRIRARPGERVQAVDFLAWYSLQGDSLNREETATASLDQVTVASAGHLRLRPGAAVAWTPLLTSSAQSAVVPAAALGQDVDPVRLLAGFRPDGERRVIAARLRGALPTAFPDGPPAPAPDLPPHRARSDGPANLVVIHDTDLLDDRFWVRVQDFFGQPVATPFAANGALVVNLADTLSGTDGMVSLRSRGEALRPFTRIEAMRGAADARFRATERQLTERLQASEARLRELREGAGGASQGALTAERGAEIERVREAVAATRRELRGVQLALRRDIEALETRLRLLNIVLVPALLSALALALAFARARRRAARRA